MQLVAVITSIYSSHCDSKILNKREFLSILLSESWGHGLQAAPLSMNTQWLEYQVSASRELSWLQWKGRDGSDELGSRLRAAM